MSELTQEQKNAIDTELGKVGKTVGKLLDGFLTFAGETFLPILVKIGAALLESWGKKVLKKNGVDLTGIE